MCVRVVLSVNQVDKVSCMSEDAVHFQVIRIYNESNE